MRHENSKTNISPNLKNHVVSKLFFFDRRLILRFPFIIIFTHSIVPTDENRGLLSSNGD